jgi:hypothetical protein
MNRRTDVDGENKGADANQSDVLSRPGVRRLDAVIPFPRPSTAASVRSGAGDTPPVSSAFVPLGEAVDAVVMKLRGDFPRLRVLRIAREGDDPER